MPEQIPIAAIDQSHNQSAADYVETLRLNEAERHMVGRDAVIGFMVDDADRTAFTNLIDNVPPGYQSSYYDRLKDHLAAANEASSKGGVRGLLNELQLIRDIMAAGQETVDFRVGGAIGEVNYRGYSKWADISAGPDKDMHSLVDCDIPISREGVPYVFETKSYMRAPYGFAAENYNQALKYQAAIDGGMVDGASIQLQGRVSPKMMEWAAGTEEAVSPVSDVEMLYSLQLPSGQKYTTVLKPGAEGKGLRFTNPEITNPQDAEIVAGLEAARAECSLMTVLAAETYDPSVVPAELAPYMDNPMKLRDPALFQQYKQIWQTALYDRLRAKAPQYIAA